MKRNFRYITKFEEETRSRMQTREAFNPIYYEHGVFQVKKQSENQTDENGEPLEIGWYFSFRKGRTKDSDNNISEVFSSKSEATNALNKEIEDETNKWEATEGRSSSARLEKRGYGLKATDVIGYAWEGELLTVEFVKHLYKTKQVEFDADSLKGRKDMNGIPEGLTANGDEYMPIFGSTELDESDRKMLLEGRSSSTKLETRDGAKAEEMNKVEARELYYFADNESALQNQQKSIITNLARKFAKGVYNKDLAIKLWTYLADSASKLYSKENGVQFAPATRRETARMLEELHFPSVQDEAIDYKKRSTSARLEQRKVKVDYTVFGTAKGKSEGKILGVYPTLAKAEAVAEKFVSKGYTDMEIIVYEDYTKESKKVQQDAFDDAIGN